MKNNTTEVELGTGFSTSEKKKIQTHLSCLLPHLKKDEFAIVGGLEIRYHLAKRGILYPERNFNDLDIIVKNEKVLSPNVKENFQIYHYHPNETPNYFVALVDPVSKTKVDIFSWYPAPKELVKVRFQDFDINIVSAEDQLVKTTIDIQRISEEAKVDPKQFLDAKLLLEVVNIKETDKRWQKYKKDYPDSILNAVKRANDIATKHPEWVQEKPFRKPKPYKCEGCRETKDFKLEPMENVYKTLGYIE